VRDDETRQELRRLARDERCHLELAERLLEIVNE
jgi:rubrerythrin